MRPHRHLNILRTWTPLIVLMFCLAAVFLAYQPGFSGGLYYDDMGPLSRLAHVKDWGSAIYFMFSDASGVLGRPIAMASFLLHASDWPNNTATIFRFNVLIHLLNGILVAGIVVLLLRVMRGRAPGDAWLAIGTSVLWLVLPLQVSTSLIAIQRMAGLSAFFVFSGLLIHLKGLSIQVERGRLSLILQGTGLGLFTVLAMFTKENGVLLPIFAWVMESTLLSHCTSIARWQKVRFKLFHAIFTVISAYLIYIILSSEAHYLSRQFTLSERLMTEPQILIDYFRLVLLPRTFAFNPFHDDYVFITNLLTSPLALASIIIWIGLLVVALAFRQRASMLAFAVLWFLAAHLLESTVVPLELYFEHRNYVALFGPCLTLVWYIARLSSRYPRITPTVFVIYLVIQLLILVQVTSLWGNRILAAEMWFIYQPTSFRAAAQLAAIYNNERKNPYTALRILDQVLKSCPYCVPSAIQAVMLSCILEPKEQVQLRLENIESIIKKDEFIYSQGAIEYLQDLHNLVKRGDCSMISWSMLENINRIFLENRFIRARGQKEGFYVNLHDIFRERGEYSKAITELDHAWRINKNVGLSYPMLDLWISQKMFQEATHFINNEMCAERSFNPILFYIAEERCKSAREWVYNIAIQSNGR